jgi:hypothetical protein
MVRIVKLLKAVVGFKLVLNALFAGLQSIAYIGVLIFIFYYMFAIIGCSIFSGNGPSNFGKLHYAMLTLFQVATMDSWGPIMYIQYYGCDKYPLSIFSAAPDGCIPTTYGFPAFLYFLFFILIGSFIMLALFTGVVTSAMSEELERTVKREVWFICFFFSINSFLQECEREIDLISKNFHVSKSQIETYRRVYMFTLIRFNFDIHIQKSIRFD